MAQSRDTSKRAAPAEAQADPEKQAAEEKKVAEEKKATRKKQVEDQGLELRKDIPEPLEGNPLLRTSDVVHHEHHQTVSVADERAEVEGAAKPEGAPAVFAKPYGSEPRTQPEPAPVEQKK